MNKAITRAEPATLAARRAMVDNQIRTFDVTDQRVLEAFYLIPRELFLPPALADLAYSDAALVVEGSANTRRALLMPMILARMIQGLTPAPTDKALVVGCGTGYAATLLAELTAKVVAVESDEGFGKAIGANAAQLGLSNLESFTGPLVAGQAAQAPYDSILICGAVETNLEQLVAQLAPKGRLVAIETATPEATRRAGKATLRERTGSDVSSRVLFDANAPVLDEFRQAPSFVF